MSPLLLLLFIIIEISHGQQTLYPNATNATNVNNTSCDLNNCQSYISSNSSWLLPDGNGCKDKLINGTNISIICTLCPNENNQCECVSISSDVQCAINTITEIVIVSAIIGIFSGIFGLILKIILISIGCLFGLCCIIICIIYCICGSGTVLFVSGINKDRNESKKTTEMDQQNP